AMKAMRIALAASSAGQPPMQTISMSATLASSNRITMALVAFDDALSRLGWSMITSRCSSSGIRWRMIRTPRGDVRRYRAGVVELADTPALGAGGAAWLIGALEALESETGWSAASAEYIVGTSAGSVIGTLVASGIPPAYISAYASGRSLDGLEPPPGLELDVDELAQREAGEG